MIVGSVIVASTLRAESLAFRGAAFRVVPERTAAIGLSFDSDL
jgi:hypothetical protein